MSRSDDITGGGPRDTGDGEDSAPEAGKSEEPQDPFDGLLGVYEAHVEEGQHELPTIAQDEDDPPSPSNPPSSPAQVTLGGEAGVGQVIDRYKLLQQIGEGGFGFVYLAQQSEPVKRRVALKIIKPGMDSKEVIARFEAERQALALMDHPNIAHVHDAGTTRNGRPYFVMELVKGIPITTYCAEHGLGVRARLELFIDVCSAVQHAHQKGIIHRDLKPSNILVSPHDGRPVVKVIDFGIAKAISMELTDKTVFTQFGRMIGTPEYMSPEQAELNALDVDTRSDVYSLGTVLYELLTGTTPLDGEKLRSAAYDEMRRLIREETAVKPSTRISAVHRSGKASRVLPAGSLQGDLDWITMKALEKDRARRYETASDLAQDIGRHLGDEPVSAGPPTAGYRLGKFVRRNRRELITGTLATLALLVGLAVALWVWLASELEGRERLADIEKRAETLIDEAERLMEANRVSADYDDATEFQQAQQLARRLGELVGLEEAAAGLRDRRDRLLGAIESERHDRELIAHIEEALANRSRTGADGRFGKTSDVNAALAAAFRRYGFELWGQSVGEAEAWLAERRPEVRSRILAGMIEWSSTSDAWATLGALWLNAIVSRADPDPWRERLRGAIRKNDRGLLEELAESVELTQQPIMTLMRLERALEKAEAPEAQERLLRRAQRVHPENFWTNLYLGLTLVERSQEGLRSGEDVKGMTVTYGRRLGGDQGEREVAEAVGFLRAAAVARPDLMASWFALGGALYDGDYLEEAVAAYSRAIELDPEFGVTYINLGRALHAQKKHAQAIAAYRRAIELEPEVALGYINLASSLSIQDQHADAVAACERAIELQPDLAFGHYTLGTTLFYQGDRVGAVAACRRAIELDPDWGLPHHFLGDVFLDEGRLEEAAESYLRCIQLDPTDAPTHRDLGVVRLKQGKIDEAIASIRRAIELDDDNARAHRELGHALHEQGEVGEALDSYRRAIELDEGDAMAHNNLGVALADLDRLEEAIVSCRRAIELDPDHELAHSNLGAYLMRQGNWEEAERYLRRAIELNPESVRAHAYLGRALALQAKLDEAKRSSQRAIELDPEFADGHLTLGGALLIEGNYADAEGYLRRAIELEPDSPEAQINLGLVLINLDRSDEAESYLRRTIELEDSPEALINLGLVLLNLDRSDEAESYLRRAIELEPDSLEALVNLGLVLGNLDRSDEAEGYLRRAIELEEGSAEAARGLGMVLAELGRPGEAITWFQRAIELDPTQAASHYLYGHALEQEGKGREAVASYRQAVDLDPDEADYRKTLGILLRKLGEFEEAAASLSEAIRLGAESASAHCNLGYVLKALGRFEEAVPVFQAALRLAPGDLCHHLGLVDMLARQERYDEAMDLIQLAKERHPADPEVYASLGSLLSRQGQFEEVARVYRKYIELAPDNGKGHAGLGFAFDHLGKEDEAIRCFRRAIELDPGLAEAHSRLGVVLFEKGQTAAAIESLRRAVEIDPEAADVHNLLGNYLDELGETDPAIESYQRAIELGYVMAHGNLGILFRNQNEYDQAIASFRRAIDLNPEEASTHANLGVCLSEVGRFGEAVPHLRRVIELEPDNAGGHYNLGVALWELGACKEASDCQRRAIELGPGELAPYVSLSSSLLGVGEFAAAREALNQASAHPDSASAATVLERIEWVLQSAMAGETKLVQALREPHPDAAVIAASLQEVSREIPIQIPVPEMEKAAREIWQDSRSELLPRLGSAKVRILTLRKSTDVGLADTLLADLQGGADFSSLAREHSIDSFAEQGGLRGEVSAGDEDMRHDLLELALSMESGEVRLSQDQRFCYLVQVDSHQAGKPGDAADFEAPGVRQAAEAVVGERARREWERRYLEQLRKRLASEAGVESGGAEEIPAEQPDE